MKMSSSYSFTDFHANQRMVYTYTRFETQAQGNSEMAYSSYSNSACTSQLQKTEHKTKQNEETKCKTSVSNLT